MGVSRNAVIGKVHRLGITRSIDANRQAMSRSHRSVAPAHLISVSRAASELGITSKTLRLWANKNAIGHQWFGALHLTREHIDRFREERTALRTNVIELVVRQPHRPPPPPPPADHCGRSLRLLQLEGRMCRYPVNDPPRGGEFLFCGDETRWGRVYCDHHYAKSFFTYIGRVLPAEEARRRRG
jgi:hypothetical protein